VTRQRTGAGERVGDSHGDEDAVSLGAHVTTQQDGADERVEFVLLRPTRDVIAQSGKETDERVGEHGKDDDERRDDTVHDQLETRQINEVRIGVSPVPHGKEVSKSFSKTQISLLSRRAVVS